MSEELTYTCLMHGTKCLGCTLRLQAELEEARKLNKQAKECLEKTLDCEAAACIARNRLEIQLSEKDAKLGKAFKALKSVDDWFERMKEDHHEKLVEGQTFESASENWDKLLQEPLDMQPIKDALAEIESGIAAEMLGVKPQ